MERADDMGMWGNTLYHGTAVKPSAIMDDGNIFDEFKLWNGVDDETTVGSPVSTLGVSLAETPALSADFARLASQKGGHPEAILPVRFRAEKVGRIDMNDYGANPLNKFVYGDIQQAWDDGHDAIRFVNYTTPSGESVVV
jgi:hypothetical protein